MAEQYDNAVTFVLWLVDASPRWMLNGTVETYRGQKKTEILGPEEEPKY